MTSELKVGDEVVWTSQSAGRTLTKVGTVERILPAGDHPGTISTASNPGRPRDHVSYLIRVKGRGLYWPRVSKLKRTGDRP